jgi:transposase-like protein
MPRETWTPRRIYSREEREAATLRAVEIGDDQAAAIELGIPRRTITHWKREARKVTAVAETRQSFAERYADAESRALDRVLRILDNPRSRPRDVIQAGEWVSKQRALLLGQATANNMNVTVNSEAKELSWDEAAALRRWLDEVEAHSEDDEALEAAAARYRLIVAGRPELLEMPDVK